MAEPSKRDVQILMTLAGLAYGEPSALPRYLAQDKLTGGDLSLAWGPTPSDAPDVFAFVARSAASGVHYVAIRGTYPNPLSPAYWNDGAFDNPFGPMQPWTGAERVGARISAGTWRAIWALLHMPGGGGTLQDYLAALPQGASVRVCGHSLGGTLTPVLALWLSEKRPDLDILGAAFAGMTPGNKGFASLFGRGRPLADRLFRYNNSLDPVGFGWDRVTKAWNFYDPRPKGGLLVQALLAVSALRLLPYGFTAIGPETVLKGKLREKPVVDTAIIAFAVETLHQHLPATYLELLGAPPLPFDIGFGSVVMEVDPASAPRHMLSAAAGRRRPHPYYVQSRAE